MLLKKIILILEALLMTAFVMAEENRSVKLNSGYDMPVLGLGTWTLTGELVKTPFMLRSNLATV